MELALSIISLALAVYDRIEREIKRRRKKRHRPHSEAETQ